MLGVGIKFGCKFQPTPMYFEGLHLGKFEGKVMKAKSDTALSSSIKTSVCSTCIEIKHIAYTDRILIPGVGFL